MRGPCVELTGDGCPPPRCDRPGAGVSMPCPSGRPPAEAGPYCDEHGGLARAQREAEADWNHLAPASVGDETAVQAAGCLDLDSTCVYVVLREEHGRWLAWLGIGGHTQQVHSPLARPLRRKRGEEKKDYERRASAGGCAFDSRELAEAEGRRVWREQLDRRVADITRRRGGTLAWGVPIAPLAEPQVLDATGVEGGAWALVML